jgi:Ca-activated chloride channel family protein
MAKKPNLYALLGVLRSATQEEVRRAYLRAAKRLHPDTNTAPGETELFLGIQQAYQVLSDSSRRSAYDAQLGPDEELPPTFINQRILFSRKEISRMKQAQLVYVLLDLFPNEKQKRENSAAPLNICLVLDCSTSMKGEKFDTAKSTAIHLVQRLKNQDLFSMVSFSDRAEVVLPATRQVNIQRSESKIRNLQTSGGTEILRGLQAGFEEVRRYASPRSINHILLMTDGRTYGDEQACYELAQRAAEEGIGISGFGIGSGWNDIFLDHLANVTGGTTMFVTQPKDIERLLNEKFTNLSRAYAENITLDYRPQENVEINYIFRLQPETGPLASGSPIRLGPILHDEPLSVLIEFRIKPLPERQDALNLLDGRLEISSAIVEHPIPPNPLILALSVKDNPTPEPPPASIIQAISRLTYYRIQEKARTEVTAGEYDQARDHLQNLATRLLAQGERGLAATIMLEAEHIEKEKSFSQGGEKQIKYGTRALSLPKEKRP